jgi:G3E family GTPase
MEQPQLPTHPPQHKIPATLFSGFLGSGKTTIISHVIDDLQADGVQVAYVKNEVGNDTIDEDIIRGKHILTKELLNGCICCTLVGDFHQALTEIVETLSPDRVIIEASGTGDPTAIALTLQSHPQIRRDGVITIIDVVNYNGVPELNSISQRQAEFTDLIIFNKVEQVDDERKHQVVGYVREVNSAAPIIEAPHGHVHPSLVFGIYPSDIAGQTRMLELKRAEVEREQQLHQDGVEHSHLETDHIESFSFELHEVYDGSQVVRALSALPKQVFRVKGYLKLGTAEGEKLMLINGVNQQIEVSDVPEGFAATQGVMVFIGFMITQLRDQVEQTLDSAVAPTAA